MTPDSAVIGGRLGGRVEQSIFPTLMIALSALLTRLQRRGRSRIAYMALRTA
jgi:hypothetical protein